MTPPVLILTPDRATDVDDSGIESTTTNKGTTHDRRKTNGLDRQRMRVGLRGLLTSTDRRHTITVLYSLNALRMSGRLRLMDPKGVCPPWLAAGRRLWLSGDDGLPLRIRVTAVKLGREDRTDDDHFAEFVVPQVAQ